MNPEQSKAVFITFYSFKGGVGRSMALINTAGILAGRRGFRVLVLDLDLEAPGLSYLDPELPDVSPAQAQRRLPLQPGFVDLLSNAKEHGEKADLFTLSAVDLEARYTQKIKIPESLREFPDGSLRIMPAGLFDRNYAERLDALNLSALYREGLGEPLIRAFKKKFAEASLYDYVLVDSRTGMAEGAGICTRDLADHVMILSGLNRQNVEGTCEFLREFRTATDGKMKFQIILSPMPNGEDKLLDERREAAEKAFQQAWGSKVDLSLEIPYHPQLALTEEPHIFRRRRGYLFEAYRDIERSMLEVLGHVARVFMKRIEESLGDKDYSSALRDLQYMVRLDRGRYFLSRVADNLGADDRPSLRTKAEGVLRQEQVTLHNILGDKDGRKVVEFVVDNLLLEERGWGARALVRRLTKEFPDLADRLYKRMVKAAPEDVDTLLEYGSFLENQCGDLDGADAYYKRAIEADPKNAVHLGNYGVFLQNRRGDLDGAEAFYRRAFEVDPEQAHHLGNYALFLQYQRKDMDQAEAYYKRATKADPKSSRNLVNYASFLRFKRKDMDAAEEYYKRAITADPKNAEILVNYASFLRLERKDMDGAGKYYKRAITADPKNADHLGNYANFLRLERKDMDGAEKYYKRAIEADPKSADHLGNYARFLRFERKDMDGAEAYYKRAIEADPKSTDLLGYYANLLWFERKDMDSAEKYYKRAIEADPKSADNLSNYGQFLLSCGRLAEGEKILLLAFEHLNRSKEGPAAEVCLSLWLISQMQKQDAGRWERHFKFFIQQGFKRYSWSFDHMLEQAKKKLSSEEFEYAKALVVAFLDESKVPELERYEHWHKLEPLDLKAQPSRVTS